MDRFKMSKWKVALGAPDTVNIKVFIFERASYMQYMKLYR